MVVGVLSLNYDSPKAIKTNTLNMDIHSFKCGVKLAKKMAHFEMNYS
jgi:hypothetical protein